MARHALFLKTKYFILDMDGTFYLGSRMIDGAGAFVRSLEKMGLGYRFFSNNSSHSAASCHAKLKGMGFPAAEGSVLLSSHVAADFLARCFPGAGVFLLGNENLAGILRENGVRLVSENPDLVLLGFDTTLTYEKIVQAANLLARGLPYYATHPDVNCPTAEGFLPDTGAMIALFAASTGRTPHILGKPERSTVDFLVRRLHCLPEELVFVGDRLETDVAIGARHGIPSVLVLSGVTTAAQAAASLVRPGLIVPSLAQLCDYL
ncbi:MAG: HAD-IIA family hydrolase [Oscillospiraceae bacterium]|nr:HAD-IIA family hydrolase [Oscillospiraceae bacterium]